MNGPVNSANWKTASLEDWTAALWSVYKGGWDDRSILPTTLWLRAVEDAVAAAEYIRKGEQNKFLKPRPATHGDSADDEEVPQTVEDKEGAYVLAVRHLARTFCWVCCFTEKLKLEDLHGGPVLAEHGPFGRLSNMLWSKYPGTCPLCWESICCCPPLAKKEAKRFAALNKHLQGASRAACKCASVNDWAAMFSTIYRESHSTKSMHEIGFHFLEEIGEVAKAYRLYVHASYPEGVASTRTMDELRLKLVWEIADTLSWVFSIFDKIGQYSMMMEALDEKLSPPEDTQVVSRHPDTLLSNRLTLWRALWWVYRDENGQGLQCDICMKPACECPRDPPPTAPRSAQP